MKGTSSSSARQLDPRLLGELADGAGAEAGFLGAVGLVERAAGEDPDAGHELRLLAAAQHQHLERALRSACRPAAAARPRPRAGASRAPRSWASPPAPVAAPPSEQRSSSAEDATALAADPGAVGEPGEEGDQGDRAEDREGDDGRPRRRRRGSCRRRRGRRRRPRCRRRRIRRRRRSRSGPGRGRGRRGARGAGAARAGGRGGGAPARSSASTASRSDSVSAASSWARRLSIRAFESCSSSPVVTVGAVMSFGRLVAGADLVDRREGGQRVAELGAGDQQLEAGGGFARFALAGGGAHDDPVVGVDRFEDLGRVVGDVGRGRRRGRARRSVRRHGGGRRCRSTARARLTRLLNAVGRLRRRRRRTSPCIGGGFCTSPPGMYVRG